MSMTDHGTPLTGPAAVDDWLIIFALPSTEEGRARNGSDPPPAFEGSSKDAASLIQEARENA